MILRPARTRGFDYRERFGDDDRPDEGVAYKHTKEVMENERICLFSTST